MLSFLSQCVVCSPIQYSQLRSVWWVVSDAVTLCWLTGLDQGDWCGPATVTSHCDCDQPLWSLVPVCTQSYNVLYGIFELYRCNFPGFHPGFRTFQFSHNKIQFFQINTHCWFWVSRGSVCHRKSVLYNTTQYWSVSTIQYNTVLECQYYTKQQLLGVTVVNYY